MGKATTLDITDENVIVAPVADVRAVLCDEDWWHARIPGAQLRCIDDRGPLGKRWAVGGDLVGSAEVWLEEWADAVVVHVFWQVDRADKKTVSVREQHRYSVAVKRHVMALKDTLEAGRAPGTPRVIPTGE
ncbi:MAG: polyketide cyclase / dehydrase and lipid transport [Actinomycetia bacterium]|nr:polyketide cyclase / dehydrase and lipid transport [Actinomycetes bacterium]